jgi:hypothetical protein
MYRITVIVIFISFVIGLGEGLNKYSAEANVKQDVTKESPLDFRNLEKPFRMAKLNVLWSKAQLVRNRIIVHVFVYACQVKNRISGL